MTVPQRAPGNFLMKGVLGGTALALGLATYAVLQLGHRLNSADGQWLPSNPVRWTKTGTGDWTLLHTVLAVVATIALVGLLVVAVRLLGSHQARLRHVDAKARHMGLGKEMHLKAVTAKNAEASYSADGPAGLMLAKAIQTRQDLWLNWRFTLTAIMSPGSGKTTALAIPFALDAPGWVYGTTNKRDFTDAIWEPRAALGDMKVFDPQEIADAPPDWYWNPLSYILPPGGDLIRAATKARIQANLFADAGAKADAKTDGFFEPAGRDLVTGLLLAAAIGGHPITQVARWVTSPERPLPVKVLRDAGQDLAADELAFAYNLNPETKRGVFANAKGVVNFLFNTAAIPWITKLGDDDDRPEFKPHQFVRSEHDTLISLSKEGIDSLGPLVAALTVAVTEAAQEYAKTCRGGRLPRAGLMILDEAANVARIDQLPNWYSHFASQGICPITILQSRAQGQSAWSATGMEKLIGASTHVIYGRGIKDVALLRDLSTVIGQHDEYVYSTGSSTPSGIFGKGAASRSTNASRTRVDIMTPADIAALPEWRALVEFAGGRPVLCRLIPYWERSDEMKAAVDASKAIHDPGGAPQSVEPTLWWLPADEAMA